MSVTLAAEIDIDAPAGAVWQILTDLTTYAEWNPFTPRIDASLVVGEPVVLHVAMKPGRSRIIQTERCSAHDASRYELGWGMTLGAPLLLRANRIQRLTPLTPQRCHYWTGDTFAGLLVPLVMALYRKHIERGFAGVAQGLKARAEGRR